MLIDTKILDELSEKARGSERLSPRFHVAAGSDVIGINVPAGQWHNLENVENGTVLLESKDGKYFPLKEEDILNA